MQSFANFLNKKIMEDCLYFFFFFNTLFVCKSFVFVNFGSTIAFIHSFYLNSLKIPSRPFFFLVFLFFFLFPFICLFLLIDFYEKKGYYRVWLLSFLDLAININFLWINKHVIWRKWECFVYFSHFFFFWAWMNL